MSGIKTTFHPGKDLTTARNPENLQSGRLLDHLTAAQSAMFTMDIPGAQYRAFVCRFPSGRLSVTIDCEMIGTATGGTFR